jgi:hypothetical protein
VPEEVGDRHCRCDAAIRIPAAPSGRPEKHAIPVTCRVDLLAASQTFNRPDGEKRPHASLVRDRVYRGGLPWESTTLRAR